MQRQAVMRRPEMTLVQMPYLVTTVPITETTWGVMTKAKDEQLWQRELEPHEFT